MPRKLFLILVLVILAATPARAAEPAPFTPQAFAHAQAAGDLIILHFNAFWCPTCGAQRPILADILDHAVSDLGLRNVAIFTIDFDRQAGVTQRFNVPMPGTLIVFNGQTEVGRLTGETDPVAIEALLLAAKTDTPESIRHALLAARMLMVGSYVLAFLAGLLSMLSPCVLPLIPVVVGGAAVRRSGVSALIAGVAVSYVATGLFVATVGLNIGLNSEALRMAAAALMAAVGLVLLYEPLQSRFAFLGGWLGGAADQFIVRMRPSGLRGQFAIGMLLGAVWSPCTGPTLAAAATLAAQRETLGQVAVVMLLFGLGAAVPLALIGMLSRHAVLRWRRPIAATGRIGSAIFGGLLLVFGGVILGGWDRSVEIYLIQMWPQWLTDLTIRF